MIRDVRLTNTGQLLDLQRRLRAAGNESLRASMRRRVRRAAEPLKEEMQSAVRHNNIRGSRGGAGTPSRNTRPLRATVATAIRISVRNTGMGVGAKVWVDKDQLPADLRNMPQHIDSGRIRHPVFGNRHNWTSQDTEPFWEKSIKKHEARMVREIDRIISDVKNRLS